MDRYHYSAYGLSISVNYALPGLSLSLAEMREVDVEIELSERNQLPSHFKTFRRGAWSPLSLFTHQRPSKVRLFRSLDEPLISLHHPTGVEFVYAQDTHTIWVNWHPLITFEYTAALLMNIGLAYHLQLRHFTCLHGSAVAIDGEAVLFLAESGMGKSTTAAFFAQRGHPVITDDISVLHEQDGHIWITPGYPSLRLFEAASTPLAFAAPPVLTPIAPEWDKQYLSLVANQIQFTATPLPIRRVYLIVDWAARASLEPVPAAEAVAWLNRYNYLYHLSNLADHARNFAFLARMATLVPLAQLKLPDQITNLPQLYDVVMTDLNAQFMKV